MRPLLLAIRFLTCIPVPGTHQCRDEHWGRSLLAYPLVGLLVGATILVPMLLSAPVQIEAGLILLTWVVITGGLHLDGLADSADGWAAGMKAGDRASRRQTTLDIMKDPHAGAVAILTLVLTLIVKYAALQAVVQAGHWQYLLLIPVLARSAVLALLLTTPYVREQGLAALMLATLPVKTAWASLVAVMALVTAFLQINGLMLLAVGVLVLILLRTLMMRRLGGTTGDTAGALVEISELVLLVVVALAVF